MAYLIYFFIRLIVKIKQAGCKELKNFWTAIELLMLLLSVVSIVMFILRQIFIVNTLQDVKNKDQGLVHRNYFLILIKESSIKNINILSIWQLTPVTLGLHVIPFPKINHAQTT